MVQTDLKSDNFCGFNQAASPMFWILDPVQNNVQFSIGETGVFSGMGLHTPAEVIDVSSSIVGGGRDNFLVSCVPPVPSMLSDKGNSTDASIRNIGPALPTQGFNNPEIVVDKVKGARFTNNKNDNNFEHLENIEHFENTDSDKINNQLNKYKDDNTKNVKNYSGLIKADSSVDTKIFDRSGFLQPETTTFKRSAMDYSSVNWHAGFSGNSDNLHTNPQNLTYVIERMWLERGGLDQNQMIKQSQEKFVPNTGKGPLGIGKQTCEKIRQPYNIKYPFGLPTGQNGETISIEQSGPSQHFNAIDVASLGKSSPMLDQDNRIPFNYNAIITNGGCNNISFFEDNLMCSDKNNDLTGVNDFSFGYNILPAGLHN